MKTFVKLFEVSAILTVILSGCDKVGHDKQRRQELKDYKVVVILPLNEGKAESWLQTAEMALENIEIAQRDFPSAIKLNLEWHDENCENLDSLAQALGKREDVCCVIGPQYSGDCDIVASRLAKMRKTMISPCATSAELMRSYAGCDFFWSMVEPDITQCEILLARLIAYGYEEVSLLASKSLYGNTFIDWFSYQATEMGLTVRNIYKYDDNPEDSSLSSIAAEAFKLDEREDNYAIIAAPTNPRGAITILDKHSEAGPNAPKLLFSDTAMSAEVLRCGAISEFAEGVSPYADPESGFPVAYEARFGTPLATKEAQLYDAIMIVNMALTAMEAGLRTNLNEAIKYIVDTDDEDSNVKPRLNCWRPGSMARVLSSIRDGKMAYDISGASGPLDFDARQYTTVVRTIYVHWQVYKGHFVTLDYLSTNGSNRVESSLASWQWNTSVHQEFQDVQPFNYPDRTDNWALVVAGSTGWTNYRHQADALNIYQILKEAGYNDDHIVLIAEDDLAFNSLNPTQGSVKRYDGEELYKDIKIDYHISDISPSDITDIILGNSREGLSEVISSGSGSNVFVFWSGHGEPEVMLMSDRPVSKSFTEARMEELLSAAYRAGCYRKMFWFLETCYSASVAIAAQNLQIPGVLMFTSASALEPSKADVKKDGIWMTNRFTKTMMEVMSVEPDIDFRRLYLELNKLTTGSHVCVLNSTNFDSLYKTNLLEFIIPVNNEVPNGGIH